MTTYVALLRGINVGGNTIISMAKLTECFEKLGYKSIKTYINSGNVIFQATSSDSRKLEDEIENAILKNFSLSVKVVVRDFAKYKKLIDHIPKNWRDTKEYKYNVIFLTHKVDSPTILDNLRPKPDIEELHYYPGVVFWSAKTSDLTKSNMIKISRLSIYKEMTVRNINTTRKIYELMRQLNS